MKNYNDDIGKWLKKQRELKHKNQQDVADYFGTTKTAVHYWETGKRQITAETMMRYCYYLGVDPQDLIRDITESERLYARLQR